MSQNAAEVLVSQEETLDVDEFIDVLVRSTLSARRPVDDHERMSRMIDNSSLILTARVDGLLVGIARSISDFAYCTYLSDLAVDVAWQRRGIGRRLIEATHAAAGLDHTLILLSAPQAVDYYPHIGMQPHGSCWIRRPVDA